jgi:hypothetical protein
MIAICIFLFSASTSTSKVCKETTVAEAFQVLASTRYDPVLDCRDIYNPTTHTLRIECHAI